MASYGSNPPGSTESNARMQAVYDQINAVRKAQKGHNDDPPPSHDILNRFHSYNQGSNPHDYYSPASAAESPVTGLDDYPLPAAPTPPSGFGHSHHPPGASGLGPIGTMPSSNLNSVDQSNSLLNLLKFSGAQGQGSQTQSHGSHGSPSSGNHALSFSGGSNSQHANNAPPIHAPVPMPADPQGLLATLMKGNMHGEVSGTRGESQISGPRGEPQAVKPHESWNAGPTANTQEYLLNLLHRPKPAQNDQPSTNESSQPATLTPQSLNDSSASFKQLMPGNASQDSTPLPHNFAASPPTNFNNYHSPQSQHTHHDDRSKFNRFDFANPFDEFSAPGGKDSQSPNSPGPTELPAASAVHVLQKSTASAISSPGNASDHKQHSTYDSPVHSDRNRRPQSERFSSHRSIHNSSYDDDSYRHRDEHTERISEAGGVDHDAEETLAQAEEEEVQAKIVADLENMMNAETDAEFQESAEVAARDIKRELEKDENSEALDSQYPPDVAQAIRDIVDDAALGPVADSWESADADEIVVIEESPEPIKVFNFPMKPWISITMQDSFDEPRPQFRDDVILDIARLKKEFDQIDRNLVASTEAYMCYGMSKQGGVRVIRQEDGKDAKLFQDTKDRVFNVAVSYIQDEGEVPREEMLIGTGISGTVYYLQIVRGSGRDHLDDDHPEQFGFALPPASTQEGDAPGGVLKTRARTSYIHPEYFAVSRGKTINIIWPAVIMQKNIFKPGHDRVVDMERLAKECSLRINTGKAGKDFSFSHDDTVIVSLDKSGRVKFWDVRDLTAADPDADIRYPMPAHMSLEVKEPLMTLNTTPEGEKAWPTSVLLLDKQRPYQKRCALRYMIVGMKQNHTLQLWDLALGKPVQEFNLPHSKESDAVCSVAYHPSTGIVVVGHPTRNSIYLLHLSAPKYNIKGLSQVDYVQRLVAKDATIPEPDSTAVISGVREYSYANKGLLRSLYVLETPSCSSPNEEPSLFDIYTMHSKGVTAITVKQADLGWTKENKVALGVDAAEVGLVKISKLKELSNPVVTESHPPDDLVAPVKIAARPSLKDTPPPQQPTTTSAQETQKKTTENGASQAPNERKDADLPATPLNQLDKSEKKRKKREKAAAAAAAAAEKLATENTQQNGTSHSPADAQPNLKNLESKAAEQPLSEASIQLGYKQISAALTERLTNALSTELKDHRGKVDSEFRSRENAFAKSQKELLELVSSVLNENTQAVLSRIIADQFEENILPHLSSVVAKTIETQIDSRVGGKISHSIQNQMQKSLPNAVSQGLQKADLSKSITEKIAASVSVDMQESFREVLMSTITPVFSEMTITASRSIVDDVQRRTAEQMEEFEQRHKADARKIDQLTALVSNLTETVGGMAAKQAQFQEQFMKMHQQQPPQERAVAHPHPQPNQSARATSYGSPSATSSNAGNQLVPYPNNPHSNTKDSELQHLIAGIAQFMERGEFESGLIRWIQSERKHEIFDEYIVKFNPSFMRDMPALVSLSVASVVAENLDGALLREKITWVEMVLNSLYSSLPHITDPQVQDVIPNIMITFLERIEKLFMRISSRSPTDAMLSHLSNMTHMATRIRDFARNSTY
ncbi:hypothetical protein F5Y16DRAFT_339788 [Xylariaceae sp. FL0255]|nr:hypothetical protein F5Y16DRAFT_339788 [Xylariaceae sp. FL0255]